MTISRIREARTYGRGAPHSFYKDHVRASQGDLDAQARLDRHAVEVIKDAAEGDLRAQAALRTETRAMSTAAGSGGQFVSPSWFADEFATWRNYVPSFINCSNKVEDEGFGMQFNIPAITSATTETAVGENTVITASSPTGATLNAPLTSYVGEVDVSQQLMDRSEAAFDQVINQQLHQDLSATLSAGIIAKAVTGATVVTNAATTSNAAAYWADLGNAAAIIENTPGTALPPTHVFMTPMFYRYLTSLSDPSGRPLMVPCAFPPGGTVEPDDSGFTGERLLDTPVFKDGNIPKVNTNQTQVIVANMNDIYTLVTEPAIRVIMETKANQLTWTLQLYAYAGVIVRHPASIVTIQGAEYPANPTFAV